MTELELRGKIAIRLAKWKVDIIYSVENHFEVLPASPIDITDDILTLIKGDNWKLPKPMENIVIDPDDPTRVWRITLKGSEVISLKEG